MAMSGGLARYDIFVMEGRQVTRTDFVERVANDPRFKAWKDSSLRSE